MRPRILLTGFTTFLGFDVNPTEELMKRLATSDEFPDAELTTTVFPVDYAPSEREFLETFDSVRPHGVIFFGLNFKIDHIALERLAVNIDDTEKPDNLGNIRRGLPIAEDGPAAYWSTLPVGEMAAALKEAGIPFSFSNHAGAYLCNHLFYFGLHTANHRGRAIPMGFIHVPPFPEQLENPPEAVKEKLDLSGRAGMTMETLYKAACICTNVLIKHIDQQDH